jgi:hypothetical protein
LPKFAAKTLELGPSALWYFQINAVKTQLYLNTALNPHPVSGELWAPGTALALPFLFQNAKATLLAISLTYHRSNKN